MIRVPRALAHQRRLLPSKDVRRVDDELARNHVSAVALPPSSPSGADLHRGPTPPNPQRMAGYGQLPGDSLAKEASADSDS
jgi:hypothetical protein